MARKRVLSSDLTARGDFGHLSRDARLLYVLLYLLVDDEGRGPAEPALIRAQLYPHDEEISLGEIKAWLEELSTPVKAGRLPLLRLYTVGEDAYLELRDFVLDQSGRSRVKFRYPKPQKEEEVKVFENVQPTTGIGLIQLWNEFNAQFPERQVVNPSSRRLDLARMRWEEHPAKEFWEDVMRAINLSYQQGPLKNTPKVVNIELLLQEGSAEKIINGLYDPPRCPVCQKRFVEDDKKTCSDCESPRENQPTAH